MGRNEFDVESSYLCFQLFRFDVYIFFEFFMYYFYKFINIKNTNSAIYKLLESIVLSSSQTAKRNCLITVGHRYWLP